MATYKVSLSAETLSIGFGDEPAGNDRIVRDVIDLLDAVRFPGGSLLKIDGPASLPVAFAIAHKVAHLYGAIAIKDPKLSGFVVAISHHPDYPIGMVIPS
jgi:CRISPR-associated protein Csx3